MGEIVRVNARELKSFDEKKFVPKAVYQSAGIKVILAYFKKGQFIPVHTPGVELVLCVLEGEAEVVAGDERVIAGKDDLIVIPKGVKRGVKALTELTVLHVVQPPPTEEDHKEVHARIAQGRFE
ncbi:MAG: cupin domain-containing protein [Deltaproteobacteria bacterium]|jgi:quercetin dioxygenase-like cupin family protein|nr:cupin domain-containing protein [Deltaproteobacteria bacterium]MBW1747830.1 cupin domain-containing protein [Deltaproteobacteria bacterium]MBW1826737.1 cupin domain-containing protein [Deltaproteobacteria bacterium]MBW1970978.1 cupin domain-containing protein [Deltaproteobacteria bacterium]MBW2156415.1 cupin domain-containing protein [Deltaproteobacteria bacterium]